MINATINSVAKAAITIRLSLKDKVLVRILVRLAISAANIRKICDTNDKKTEKVIDKHEKNIDY
jgi:hypothetical protein